MTYDFGSTPKASYALQEKASKFSFKKFDSYSFSGGGSCAPTWKYFSLSSPIMILFSPLHCDFSSKDANRSDANYYKAGFEPEELTSNT